MPAPFNINFLRARVLMHDLYGMGFDTNEISQRTGIDRRIVRRYLARKKPDLDSPPVSAWTEQAACVGADQEMFFPDKVGLSAVREKNKAAKICRGCPVRKQCLAAALANCEMHGVWAGIDFSKVTYHFDESTGRVVMSKRPAKAVANG